MSDVADVFRRLTMGVYVVGVAHREQRDAFTAAWLTQVSFDPLLLALSINTANASYALLRAGGRFAISVLARGQLDLARHFGTTSGRERDKLAGVRWHAGYGGAPILDDALAYLECERVSGVPAGDHELVLARVVGARVLSPDAAPLAYADTGDMDGSRSLYPEKL
ncbi:MAG TPA: flavin reductase family protein [Gemmatimonadaceae bacterium]|jgi:flavin reductase (DIM6/NTAB) family NADH-FMN oxidoreductase RutF|nr:flavin reductase family protein [Gemmatimonadaceae bacterium]